MSAVTAYANNAIPSTPATLGVTNQPALTRTTSTGSPNARVSTGYSAVPAAVTTVTSGGSTQQQLQTMSGNAATAARSGIAALGATPSASPTPQMIASNAAAAVANTFGATMANDLAVGATGGSISSALGDGVARITAFAQNGIKGIEQAIQGDMAANNGQVDPAKMQQYTMQMSTFEMIMQMAAKIQEKKERAAQIWLQL